MSHLGACVAPNLTPDAEVAAVNKILSDLRRELVRVADHVAANIVADRTHPMFAVHDNADRLAGLQETIDLWEMVLHRGAPTPGAVPDLETSWAHAVGVALQRAVRPAAEHGTEAMIRQARAAAALAWLRTNRVRLAALPAVVHAHVWMNL